MATINRGLKKPEDTVEEQQPVSYLPVDSGNSLPSTVDAPLTTVPSSDADAEGEVDNLDCDTRPTER